MSTSLRTVSRVASILTSGGSVQERASYALREIRSLVAYDTLILSAIDERTHELRPVVTWGHTRESVAYFHSREWYAEAIDPFCIPRTGWPVRECDLPVDPLSIRGIAEHFRAEGLLEGAMNTLVTRDGKVTGLLMLSSVDPEPVTDEACAVLGHVSPALANVLDPLRSAEAAASIVDPDSAVVCLRAGGETATLRGTLPDDVALGAESPMRKAAERAGDDRYTAVAFLWPRGTGGWHRCRAYRCGDGTVVLAVRPLVDVYGLTRREIEVLSYLVDGRSNADIAAQLWVTTRTVRAHVEHILNKLGVDTRAAAVARALSYGLVLPRLALPTRDRPPAA